MNKKRPRGHQKGVPLSPEHRAKVVASLQSLARDQKGEKNSSWKGGRGHDSKGYVLIYSPNHPHKSMGQYVFEHRLVMEAHLGRPLLPTEVVHHINGIVDDNRIENLMLFSDTGEHTGHHHKIKNGGIE